MTDDIFSVGDAPRVPSSEVLEPTSPPPTRASASALWQAALLRYGFDACACLLLALPLRNATVASGLGAFPDAARQLYLDGGFSLLEVLYEQRASLLASLAPTLRALLLLSWLALLPEWWLLRALAAATGAPGCRPKRALTRLGVLGVGTWSLRAAVWAAGIALALFVHARLLRLPNERTADLVAATLLSVPLLLQLGVSLLRELVALRLVLRGQRVLAALGAAMRLLRARPARLAAAYATCRAASFALLLGAHGLSVALDQRAQGALALLAVLLGLAARVALETLWLRWLAVRAG
ncbi:MAG: hypothetical protein RL685_6464 [Pseudomonadota bacterium]|jgi:hypothetical protein